MNKLLTVLIAGLFSAGAYAQATPATPATPAAPAVHVTTPVAGAPTMKVTPATPAVAATPAMPAGKAMTSDMHATKKAAPHKKHAKKAHKKMSKEMQKAAS